MIRTALKRSGYATRNIHVSSPRHVASFFNMPAMSPTMTEGGVVSWKYKPGETFPSGEVLLEVETDKATIDVETLDEGVLWEIIVPEGASGIQVGEPIALIAEVGDDLATLEKPEIKKAAPKQEKKVEEPKVEETKVEASKEQKSSGESVKTSSSSVFQTANPNQKLFPSVELLLHSNGISYNEAIEKISASGPNGRLLKGDVLAHIGTINKDYISTLTSFLIGRQHLDLSHIVATPEEANKLAQKEIKEVKDDGSDAAAKAEAAAAAIAAQFVTIKVPVDSETLEDIDLFVRFAINDAYTDKFPQYEFSPSGSSAKQSQDELFDDLVSAPVTQKRFEVVSVKVVNDKSRKVQADSFDDLLGLSKNVAQAGPVDLEKVVEVTIKLNKNVPDAREFANRFAESLGQLSA